MKSRRIQTPKETLSLTPQRLQKLCSQAGYCSRRQAEELIRDGKVKVNGVIVSSLGAKADPIHDVITVSGKRLYFRSTPSTLALFKPVGFVCSRSDEEKRHTVYELLPKQVMRMGIFNVGRLDMDSQGLLLMTNDGELAHRLTHPKFHVSKVYEVKIRGTLSEGDKRRFAKGVYLPQEAERALPARVEEIKTQGQNSWIRVEIFEGKNRQVRSMCESLGHSVSKLKRVSVGPIKLGRMRPGQIRSLSPVELSKLYSAVQLKTIS